MRDPVALVRELSRNNHESEWLEFKQNTTDPEMIAERISALANGSAMIGRSCGYIIWGSMTPHGRSWEQRSTH